MAGILIANAFNQVANWVAAACNRISDHRDIVFDNFLTHPVVERVRALKLEKLALTMAFATIIAPVASDKFPINYLHYFLVPTLLWSCSLVWVGSFFHTRLAACCQVCGLSSFIVSFTALMGSFVPIPSAVFCWVGGVVFLVPFISIVVHPTAGPMAAQVVAGPEIV